MGGGGRCCPSKPQILTLAAVLQAGAVVYAMRVPERWKPGAFDLMFNSHQFLHIAVIIAALVRFQPCASLCSVGGLWVCLQAASMQCHGCRAI